MTVFGDSAFKEVIKVKKMLNGWALIEYHSCSYKKRRLKHKHTKEEDHVRTQGEDGHLEVKEKGLGRNQPC